MTDHNTPLDDADAADPTRQKLESLFQLLRGSDGPNPGDANSVSHRFRLLRRHARGGLGDIWIAHDEELDRDVALKEIQPQFAGHEQSWSRFLREATITGQLEHPGIVPIYALGRHENGQPFYAMRFVQGDSLADAIARFHTQATDSSERNLQLRKLVTRLIDVCNAVAYAHSRGVLHRDLKPSNIMLGEFGETLVVDWGLAKPIADVGDETQPPAANVAESLRDSDDPSCGATRLRETPPTQIGSAIGSPPYMSPEQAAGRLNQLSPATDIYSLGATLFELLTGQAPIGAAPAGEPRETLSIKDLLQRIQEGRFPRPSSITPDVPRALEAVCLKAMSLHPADRYASARDLASDLEAWLADEPVTAWTEPLIIRVRRWMRRHQTAVVSTAATALVAIVALSVLAFVVTDRNERLATAKEDLEIKNRALNRANDLVKVEAEVARREADNTRVVLTFFEEKMLAAARPEAQGGGLGVNVTVREAVHAAEPEIAAAFRDQPLVEASIRQMLGITYQYLGESALAIPQFERSLHLYEVELGSDDRAALTTMNNLALAYGEEGFFDLSLNIHERTLERRKKVLGSNHPDTLNSMGNLAAAYVQNGNLDLGMPLMKETLEKLQEQLGSDASEALVMKNNLAETYRVSGNFEMAISLLKETLDSQNVKVGANHPEILVTLHNLMLAYKDSGNLDLAISLGEQTVEKMRATLGGNHHHTLLCIFNLAMAYEDSNRTDRALHLYEEIFDKSTSKLDSDHPDLLAVMPKLAKAYLSADQLDEPDTLWRMNKLGMAYYQNAKCDLALPILVKTLEKRKSRLGQSHPNTLSSMHNLALTYQDLNQWNRAVPLYREALKMRRETLGSEHADTLATLGSLASALLEVKETTEALSLLEELIGSQRRQLEPEEFARVLTVVSLDLLKHQQHAAAEPYLDECLAIHTKTLPDHWTTFSTMSRLGGSLLGQSKYADAEPLLLTSYEGMKQHEADIPAQAKIRLTEAIQRLVDLYDATNQKDKAAEWRRKLPELPKPREESKQ